MNIDYTDPVVRYVLEREIPPELADAIWRAPDLSKNLTPSRALAAKSLGVPSFDADDLTPSLTRTLVLHCNGFSRPEIARRLYYSPETIKVRILALLGIFRAKNGVHLASLAVAQGYVDPLLGVDE